MCLTLSSSLWRNYSHGFWTEIADLVNFPLAVEVSIVTSALPLGYVPDSKFYKVEAILRCVLFLNLLCLLCSSFGAREGLYPFLGCVWLVKFACMFFNFLPD